MRTLIFSLCACTSTQLYRVGQVHTVDEQPSPPGALLLAPEPILYRIGDVFCAAPAKEVIVPFKLVVVLDNSGSMLGTDPNKLRIEAIANLTRRYANEPNVLFSFVRFADTTHELSLGRKFTNDGTLLNTVFDELRAAADNDEGSTNYQASLTWAYDTIEQDIAAPDHVPGTKYGVLFLTDGRPNTPINTGDRDEELTLNRPRIRERITGCGGFYGNKRSLLEEIVFLNTYFLNPEPDALASDLLRDMATGASDDPCGENNWGHGTFEEVTSADLFQFRLDLPKMRKTYVNDRRVVFMNHNLHPLWESGAVTMALDSDGDGLADSEELDSSDPYDSSPYLTDTDGDGFSDLVERIVGSGANQAATPRGLPDDSDEDGLTDDEEKLIGGNVYNADSDQDGLSDYVELRFFLNPLSALDASLDVDGDGVDTKTEVMQGMDPHHIETAEFRAKWAYQYVWGSEEQLSKPARTCYHFTIENIAVRNVYSAAGDQIAKNTFELDFIDRSRVSLGAADLVARRELIPADFAIDEGTQYKLLVEESR